MEPIRGNMLISSDTPLLEAIKIVCSGYNHSYFVLKGNEVIGFLTYDHFYKLPFRICLFALLIDLERVMLDITKLYPTLYLNPVSFTWLSYWPASWVYISAPNSRPVRVVLTYQYFSSGNLAATPALNRVMAVV